MTHHLDAQNAFGALVRTYFVCEVCYSGADRYTLENLEFLE